MADAEHDRRDPPMDATGALDHVRAQHGRPPRRVSSNEIRHAIHGRSAIGRFNNWLARVVTESVGTMWAAYVFALIALVSLPGALKALNEGDMVVAIGWLSTSFLQLVLLPIIIVGQKVISAHQDARAETDHETLSALHTINILQLEILETQQRMLEELASQRNRA